jgi:predicted GNAT family N-acyltransferase
MELIEIEFGSERYQQALHLRNDILRRPLGLDLFAEDLDVEASEWHFGIDDEGALIATVTLRPDGPGRVRLRQMAVAPERRGSGTGRLLVEGVESILRARGIAEVNLHARSEAEGFYARLGYQRVGDEFVEVGIRHVEMIKKL